MNFVGNTGEVADKKELSLDKEKIKKQETLDGFYLLVTNNLNLMPLQISSYHKKLLVTEDDFKILKSYLDLRPVYLIKPIRILAHILVCIISLLVLRIFEHLLNKMYSIRQIIYSLRDYNCYYHDLDEYFIPYTNEIIENLKKISNVGISQREFSCCSLMGLSQLNNSFDVTIEI